MLSQALCMESLMHMKLLHKQTHSVHKSETVTMEKPVFSGQNLEQNRTRSEWLTKGTLPTATCSQIHECDSCLPSTEAACLCVWWIWLKEPVFVLKVSRLRPRTTRRETSWCWWRKGGETRTLSAGDQCLHLYVCVFAPSCRLSSPPGRCTCRAWAGRTSLCGTRTSSERPAAKATR